MKTKVAPRLCIAAWTSSFAAVGIGWNLNRFSLGLQAATRLGRSLHLLHPGASAGLAVSSAMATLRIWPPSASLWVVLAVTGAVGGCLVGYLSPGPDLGMQFPVVDLTRQPEQPIRIPSDY